MVLFLYILLFSMLGYIVYEKYFKVPVGLRTLENPSVIGSLVSMVTEPNLTRAKNYYFPILHKTGIMKFWFKGSWSVVISDPELMNQIFHDQNLGEKVTFDKNPHSLEKAYYGVNIVFSKLEEWRRHRKVVGPAFKRDWPTNIFANSSIKMNALIERKEQRPINVSEMIEKGVLDALGVIGFNYDFQSLSDTAQESEILRYYKEAVTCLWNPWYFLFPILERIPLPYRIKARKNCDKLRGKIINILNVSRDKVEKQIASGELIDDDKSDLLSLMIKANRATKNKPAILDDEEIVNDVVVFFAAGHDTSSNVLSAAFYYLAKHPHVQFKIREELCSVLGIEANSFGKVKEVIPNETQVRQLVYLNAVIHEVMRMAPTVPEMHRILGRDWSPTPTIHLKKGDTVILQAYASMNDPKYWPNPNRFDPERYLKRSSTIDEEGNQVELVETVKEKVKKLFAFGGGSRLCVGATFSLVLQKVMLATVLQKFEVRLPKDSIHRDELISNKIGLVAPHNLDIIFSKLC